VPLYTLIHPTTPPRPSHTSPLSLHDALPISARGKLRAGTHMPTTAPVSPLYRRLVRPAALLAFAYACWLAMEAVHKAGHAAHARSEEHTSELQSHLNIVCRHILEKKKQNEEA